MRSAPSTVAAPIFGWVVSSALLLLKSCWLPVVLCLRLSWLIVSLCFFFFLGTCYLPVAILVPFLFAFFSPFCFLSFLLFMLFPVFSLRKATCAGLHVFCLVSIAVGTAVFAICICLVVCDDRARLFTSTSRRHGH